METIKRGNKFNVRSTDFQSVLVIWLANGLKIRAAVARKKDGAAPRAQLHPG